MTSRALRLAAMMLFTLALVFTGVWTCSNTNVLAQPPQGGNPFDTGGRDDKPAAEVFKNIQQFKTLPAGRLAGIMQNWTRVLGVKCNHCHTPGAWEREDLPAKQIARDMMQMTGKLNNELLKGIKNLKSDRPNVSCYTCHRGQVKPETAMSQPQVTGIPGGVPGGLPPPNRTPEPTSNPEPPKLIRVSGGVLQETAIKKVQPAYPPDAKAAHAAGAVQVQVTISEEGRVIEASVINGHPLLREAALEAARQWRFKPTELSGMPVRVQGVLTFNFTLQ